MISCREMARLLQWGAVRARNELEIPTEALMVVLEEEAKGFLGEYQSGWAPLKPETIARKVNGDTPLLETGEMRDSIEHMSAPDGTGAMGAIGSNDPVALWQELGTSRGIPPRPFLALAMMRSYDKAAPIFGEFAVSLFVKG